MKLRAFSLFVLLVAQVFAGYDVHITRRKVWSDDKGPAITLKEWQTLVASDSEMRLDGYAEAETTAGNKLRVQSDGLAVWTKYSGHGKSGNMAWFHWRRGEIAVKNPDREILIKMFQVAKKLGAKVQGDDGELYNEKGNAVP